MRVGDFSVEVIGAGGGPTHELESGHVVARPGQVYVLRLRNHGPLRCVAEVSIDSHTVTGNGLVINAWSSVDLERPIHATERGRFTVIAEGDERVFGPDGGRDNAALGLIEARFRRELPNATHREPLHEPTMPRPIVTMPTPPGIPSPDPGAVPPRRPMAPPGWTPLTWGAHGDMVAYAIDGCTRRMDSMSRTGIVRSTFRSPAKSPSMNTLMVRGSPRASPAPGRGCRKSGRSRSIATYAF